MTRISENKIKVLVAPLDWGLGHTTRCIPIIYELISLDVEVILAGNDTQRALLQREFPDCKFLRLEGYNISYSSTRSDFVLKVLQQVPSMLKTIRAENNWLDKTIEEYKIDAVISDNRFGLHTKKVPCIFITHQLLIKNDLGKIAERTIQRFNYQQINHFTKCWIPDFENDPNLAGALSHPEKMPSIPCEYIGFLTRIKRVEVQKIKGHILIMISGPEPQRTLFEKIIFEQLESFNGTATVVRGKPADTVPPPLINGVAVFNHLAKEDLNKELCRAEFVVCRTGYSSVMDIAGLDVKPILVPTPGQTEQEYLAKYLSKQNFCITSTQQNFNLKLLLQKAQKFQFENPFRQKKYNLSEIVKVFVREMISKT